MKLLFKDFKKGEVKIQTTSLDDLWFLSNIIDQADIISGKTTRKIKIGDDQNAKVVKKSVTLSITVERVEFHKYSNSLRISGKINRGTEEIPKGSYHTLDIDDNSKIKIVKKTWLNYQMQKLEEATQETSSKILICTLERDEATFALLTSSGYKVLSDYQGEVQKKEEDSKKETNFYSQVAQSLQEYTERYKIENIILASPAFWKEDLMKLIKKKNNSLSKIITLATCNSIGKNGVEEVLKREEVKTVLKKDRTAKETELIEELFKEISLDRSYSYGFKDVLQASDAGAIKKLLVTDELIHKKREEETFEELEQLMKKVDLAKGEVHIIPTDHEAGKKLQGISGIAAILRFKLNY